MRVDQDATVGDFVSFYRALEQMGFRAIRVFSELAEEPRRFGRIDLSDEPKRIAFVAHMRAFASAHGLEFHQEPWDEDDGFYMTGDGMTITCMRLRSAEDYQIMLELRPRSNGQTPTEPMMDELVAQFSTALSAIDGAAFVVERSSRDT
ncbi:hypothetical protein [Terricaulis silvestris]|uniref:Uncharacterized protein n=1 Tax=Terricaulis silvestris TaxID=2686094 RepID=A0A6I6MLZ2_9CAUL|nr:hypothetical protein [Terricaulis silvestris]QGZ96475.1 hypothetical protein DSM104635_03335 [Terricaulis silvestris]